MVISKGPNPKKNQDVMANFVNEEDIASDEEYDALNEQLDQLNGWLDHLEEKNADIHQQLLDLLHKSRTTREEFQKLTEPQSTPGNASTSSNEMKQPPTSESSKKN